MRKLQSLTVLAAFLATAHCNARQLENSNFETGDLTGWSGRGRVVDSAWAPALQGNFSLLLAVSDGEWTPPPQFPLLAGTAPPSPYVPSSQYNSPHRVSQQVEAKAGDILSVKGQMFGEAPRRFADQAFIAIAGSTTLAVGCTEVNIPPDIAPDFCSNMRGNWLTSPDKAPTSVAELPLTGVYKAPPSTGLPEFVGIDAMSDVMDWQLVVPESGLVTVTLGIASTPDSVVWSAALFDKIRILPRQVDEPSVWSMFTLALFALLRLPFVPGQLRP